MNLAEGFPEVNAGHIAAIIAIAGIIVSYIQFKTRAERAQEDLEKAEKRWAESNKELKDQWAEAHRELKDRMGLIETRHYDLDNKVMDKLSNIEKMVAKIEGQISAQNNKE